jgi:hypothetical protein
MGIDQFDVLKGLGEGAFASVHKVCMQTEFGPMWAASLPARERSPLVLRRSIRLLGRSKGPPTHHRHHHLYHDNAHYRSPSFSPPQPPVTQHRPPTPKFLLAHHPSDPARPDHPQPNTTPPQTPGDAQGGREDVRAQEGGRLVAGRQGAGVGAQRDPPPGLLRAPAHRPLVRDLHGCVGWLVG